MLRVDEEVTEELGEADQARLRERIDSLLAAQTINAIIFQDYNKGVIHPGLIRHVTEKANRQGIPVAVDPKRKNFLQYRGVTLFKPNLKELREGLGIDISGSSAVSLRQAASRLHDELGIQIVMTTLSEHGLFISYTNPGGKVTDRLIPAHLRNISDVSGAGDTVISVAALGLACRLEPAELASLANLAGGLVCEQVGVVPVDRDKLLEEAVRLI
jgi:rfaE bifunctional protein kinase chain/domain